MARLRFNNLSGTLGAGGLASGTGTTAITFSAALAYQQGGTSTLIPTLTGGDYLPLTLEPGTINEETVWLTTYTTNTTTGTVTRGVEGAAIAHGGSAPFANTLTAGDGAYMGVASVSNVDGSLVVGGTSNNPTVAVGATLPSGLSIGGALGVTTGGATIVGGESVQGAISATTSVTAGTSLNAPAVNATGTGALAVTSSTVELDLITTPTTNGIIHFNGSSLWATPPAYNAAQNGLVAASVDPLLAAALGNTVMVAGTVYAMKVKAMGSFFSNYIINVQAAAVTYISGVSFCALYDSTGVIVAGSSTGDIHTTFGTPTGPTPSPGYAALSAPIALTEGATYWIAVCSATYTTMPKLFGASGGSANLNLLAGTGARSQTVQIGVTTVPPPSPLSGWATATIYFVGLA